MFRIISLLAPKKAGAVKLFPYCEDNPIKSGTIRLNPELPP
jgi:hypothetical protein